ncbi:DegT/DnrJ/EryC1/StrS family aminotransferase [Taibaiella lutea]|uniref:DegT/DnrJ/EryC1/StrS family aminotransferase n=1 Tax=Taibaiella lutea TaxID=2608001 RepID=A0A5M6CMK9_9BACT|nr:DegT/DnrJ/EryC1/StrS family aminotransferase [Taibaiella lutea]KAA5536257.1 DegT/DnrJ/EryC1/StrS family aminotransferase [Taibaiella lutea]
MNILMLDLVGQYNKIKAQVDAGIQKVIASAAFVNGPQVKEFASQLGAYLSVKNVIPCANGTDALQIALMALDLQPGDEIIVPCFTYAATTEVIALLKLQPVMVEVDADTFNITAELVEAAITPKTKAIVPVHLYGQCVDMGPLLKLAEKYNLYVIEDAAQALGAEYTFSDGRIAKAGTMGDIGCTSFFPSKNLGCYGDGGALFTNNETLAEKIKMIANHGQQKKYYHEIVGVNSRLDTIQAAILGIKLQYLDDYARTRNVVAETYDKAFKELEWLETPARVMNSDHVFHQYTLKLKNASDRDLLKSHLEMAGIPSMIYYPLPLHLQPAFKQEGLEKGAFPVSEDLCTKVLSLPVHTEMTDEQLTYIIDTLNSFKKGN